MPRKPNDSGDHYNDPFPSRLRILIKEKGIKQEDLTEVLKVKNRQSVTGYIDGSTMPTIEKVVAIAEYFNVSSDYLLGLKNSRQAYTVAGKYAELFDLLIAADEELEEMSLLDCVRQYCFFPPTKTLLSFSNNGIVACFNDVEKQLRDSFENEGAERLQIVHAEEVVLNVISENVEGALEHTREFIQGKIKEQQHD